MLPAVRYGARIVAATPNSTRPWSTLPASVTNATSWTCAECRFKAQTRGFRADTRTVLQTAASRHFSAINRQLQDDHADRKQPISPTQVASPASRPNETPANSTVNLPSHVERQRWQLSKDMTKFVDRLLARASIAGQSINVYTGTDYSGIETLRQEIIDQEQKVRKHHNIVDAAKASHQEAYVKQASAQKEIVSLLERKASWSPTDLERYMSLVRSEHINDQAVQAAKDSLAASERELDEGRSLLERLERKQYHEEQIWSDTIRRNSTWVTFGLMGFNIILLLAQILFFEPYRRRKIVREVKVALDERTLSTPSTEVEKQVGDVVEPASEAIEAIERPVEEAQAPSQPLDTVFGDPEDVGKTALAAGEVLPEEAADVSTATTIPNREASPLPRGLDSWEAYKEAFHDLFSDRLVQLKQAEITTVALQGAATGVAAMGILFLLLRPK